MNSLGRVGRILGGHVESSANSQEGKKTESRSTLSISSHDSESPPSSKEASHFSSSTALSDNVVVLEKPTCLPLQEPDVIASTKPPKVITEKPSRVTNVSPTFSKPDIPIAPPRRKKKVKSMTSSLSLSVSLK